MDDTVSKALDMVGNFAQQAATKVSEVAPQVWKVMVWQSVAEGVVGLLAIVGTVATFLWARKQLMQMWFLTEKDRQDDDTVFFHGLFTIFLPTVICTIAVLIGVNSVGPYILRIINPAYYAMYTLLTVVK